jgi:hypothetical protein
MDGSLWFPVAHGSTMYAPSNQLLHETEIEEHGPMIIYHEMPFINFGNCPSPLNIQ